MLAFVCFAERCAHLVLDALQQPRAHLESAADEDRVNAAVLASCFQVFIELLVNEGIVVSFQLVILAILS